VRRERPLEFKTVEARQMHVEHEARGRSSVAPSKIGLRRGKGFRLTEQSRMVDRIFSRRCRTPREDDILVSDFAITATRRMKALAGMQPWAARAGDSGLDYP
jgi:hypothetical protein